MKTVQLTHPLIKVEIVFNSQIAASEFPSLSFLYWLLVYYSANTTQLE